MILLYSINDVDWSLFIIAYHVIVYMQVLYCTVFSFVLNSRTHFKKIISYSFQIADHYDKLDVISEIVSTEGPTGACILTSF